MSASFSTTIRKFKKKRFNFKERLPQTRHDVNNFITTWLETVSSETSAIKYKIHDETWIITHSFTREFYFHCVFKNENTGEYAFHVWNKDNEFNDLMTCCFPNFDRYSTYDKMIEGVVDKYVQLWQLN